MSIVQLPEAATRKLCATLLLISPCSAVKELLDNALDAKATAIEVLISANTLDKIQVRDNGHGIDSANFEYVGRPAHTSKLRTFEELQSKGGETLGFRGDALASASNVSNIVVTTRTALDKVASCFTLCPTVGGFEGCKPISAPIGTTVEMNNLYGSFPIRKKLLLKEVPKSIASIKTMLQAYALARPQTRLTFKILGDDRSSWSYAPRQDTNPQQAALQIFGISLA
ncbi:hypothetical protein ACHAQH_004579, partial [Verticillium albo-atrum]